jgi:DNA-binding NarL/FixJ family response regulator
MNLIATGHTNTQIARRLGLSEGTVRTHLQNIYGKLQVSSRTAAVTRAFPDQTVG